MICARCGTEHQSPDNICPRCFYGRPKSVKTLPSWAIWAIVVGGVSIVAIVVGMLLGSVIGKDQTWIDGDWWSQKITLHFDSDDNTFILTNRGEKMSGTYTINRNTFTLVPKGSQSKEGYVYHYQKTKDPSKILVSYSFEGKLHRMLLKRTELYVD